MENQESNTKNPQTQTRKRFAKNVPAIICRMIAPLRKLAGHDRRPSTRITRERVYHGESFLVSELLGCVSGRSPFSQLILHETDKSKVVRKNKNYVFDKFENKLASAIE